MSESLKHKYLNDIGINSESLIVPNTTSYDKDYIQERNTYGFDERETWNLNSTSAMWLYSHLKMYLEKTEGKKDIFSDKKYRIPVLIYVSPNNTKADEIKIVSLGEAICYIISYLKIYLNAIYNISDPTKSEESKVDNILKQAFAIYSMIIPDVYW